MADRWGRVKWPGIVSPRFCSYTMGHGTSASAAILRCNPQSSDFAMFGDLEIFDGASEPVTLRDCKVYRVEERRGADGIEWELSIYDGRWRWRETGYVNAFANQLDPHGKLIPWTIRSPVELAIQCLEAMGVSGYKIELPLGLTSSDGKGVKDLLPTGVNFPVTGVNPPCDWFYEKPHTVLEQLADMFGCRVIYRWKEHTVWIVQRGKGDDLPPGSISSRTPAIQASETPDGVMVAGAPTRYQVRLELQAVGEDWDGLYRPINDLSYAPRETAGSPCKWTVTGQFAADFQYYVIVNDAVVPLSYGYQDSATTMADIVTAISNGINVSTDPAIRNLVQASYSGDTLTITGTKPGFKFPVSVYVLHDSSKPAASNPEWVATNTQAGKPVGVDWSRCYPPLFNGVRATDRLTLTQARDLARKSVWKYYQLTGRDVSGKGNIIVPGYGRLQRRQQILLLDTQCEQVNPALADKNILDKNGVSWVQNQYNGYSRDIPAAVYGSVLKSIGHELFRLQTIKAGLNTGDPPKSYGAGTNLVCVSSDGFLVKPDNWSVTDDDIYKTISISSDGLWVPGNYKIEAIVNGHWQLLTCPVLNNTTPVPVTGGVWSFSPALKYPPGFSLKPQVQVDFNIDPMYQIVRFSEHVYKWGKSGAIEEPSLILQCAVNVRDPDTNQFVTYENKTMFTGKESELDKDPFIMVERHEDVQVNVIPEYSENEVVKSVKSLESDPFSRSQYYLKGMIARLQVSGAESRVYNGTIPAQLDGAIAQITWEVGTPSADGGAKTTISRNFEHNTNQLPYGARRRAEALASAVAPGGFMGQIVGTRQDPTKPAAAYVFAK